MASPSITASDFCQRQFDYVVIGGGTAGLVVAARLSEDPDVSVGVLEAGPAAFDDPIITVPGRFGESLGTKYDWQFETTLQPGLNGRSIPWNRGRVLGGTSALNFMAWTRGNRQDFDAWEELGNKGWGWESLLPYFKKTETFHEPPAELQACHRIHYDSEFHGTSGPVPTVYSSEYSVPHKFWHSTLESELGVPTNHSHFSGSNIGAFTTLVSVHPETRTRCSSATTYYLPSSSRRNLVVLSDAVVQEVVIEREGQEEWVAKGVKFMQSDEVFVAHASCEVILCAGSVQSPQLLELSGVGNPAVLAAAGIPLKVCSPNVGENLQDHMMTAMIFEIDPSITGPDELRANPKLAEAADLAYESTRSGPRTILPCALSYVPVSHVVPSPRLSELVSKVSAPNSSLRDRVLAKQFSPEVKRGQVEYIFDVGNWSPYFKSEPGKVYGTMLMMLQLPFTKGSVHIPPMSSGAPPTAQTNPIIDPQYYGGEGGKVDFEIMAIAQKFANKICSTAPLSDIIRSRVLPPHKGSSPDDEDFTDFVRNYTVSDWHPIGSCGMGGLAGITAGVVDERLRAYGVRSLRVIDASIMPLHICAHPQATIYAIAEKGAAMILEDRSKRSM